MKGEKVKMHIAEVKVTNQWQKLEDLIAEKIEGFTFEGSKEYTIQNIGNSNANFIEKTTTPTEEIGFVKRANETPLVYTKTNGDLYVKSFVNITFLTVSDED